MYLSKVGENNIKSLLLKSSMFLLVVFSTFSVTIVKVL